MSSAFKPKRHILPASQQKLWPHLAAAVELGFVLYGGTAIALRLGHRTSVDFDFFTDQALDHSRLRAAMPFLDKATTLQESTDTLTVITANSTDDSGGVKLSFFGSIGFGRVGTPEFTDDHVIQVASLDDLMATKLKVIRQRVEAKDYRDIAAMIGAGTSLADGLAAARQLFGNAFQPSESLKALTWFEGGDLNTLTITEQTTLIQTAGSVDDLPVKQLASHHLAAP